MTRFLVGLVAGVFIVADLWLASLIDGDTVALHLGVLLGCGILLAWLARVAIRGERIFPTPACDTRPGRDYYTGRHALALDPDPAQLPQPSGRTIQLSHNSSLAAAVRAAAVPSVRQRRLPAVISQIAASRPDLDISPPQASDGSTFRRVILLSNDSRIAAVVRAAIQTDTSGTDTEYIWGFCPPPEGLRPDPDQHAPVPSPHGPRRPTYMNCEMWRGTADQGGRDFSGTIGVGAVLQCHQPYAWIIRPR